MVKPLLLEGPSGVGKSSIASLIAMEHPETEIVEVEARSCWGILEPRERQECFAETYLSYFKNIRGDKPRIYTSGPLTLAAYTMAFEEATGIGMRDIFNRALSAADRLASAAKIIVLVADAEALRSRIYLRMIDERDRNNPVEENMSLHLAAEKWLIKLSKEKGLEVIDTSNTSPFHIYKIVKKKWLG